MNPITSLYISKIEKQFNAEFILNVFDKNGIAKLSKILLEPHKKNEKYNGAFIEVKEWCDTEAAFNFIFRLRHPIREARIVYFQDNWWSVEINKFPYILNKNYKILTVFHDNLNNDTYDTDTDTDNISTTVFVPNEENINFGNNIDYEKTRKLKEILYGFKNSYQMDELDYTYDTDTDNISTTVIVPNEENIEFNNSNINYEKSRQLKAIIYGYKNADEIDDAEYFDGYLNEIIESMNNWFYDKEPISISF